MLLAEHGTFAEIGKRGVWSTSRRAAASSRTRCHTIALDADMAHDLAWMNSVLTLLSARAGAAIVEGLPLRSFASGGGGGGTQLPFAVDDALLQRGGSELWAVRRL